MPDTVAGKGCPELCNAWYTETGAGALARRDGNTDLDTYLQAATATAEQRARLFKLATDAAVSGFAGRESLYEYFFFGDPVRMAGAQVAS